MAEVEQFCNRHRSLRLALADGSEWKIIAADEEASLAVSGLGRAMRLSPGNSGRELCAIVCQDRMRITQAPSRNDPVVCRLPPLFDLSPRFTHIHTERIASLIGLESLPRGGLLLHGALAEHKGAGYVLAGPSRVGKSTASRRLPLPHRSLSDDRTLVVRDRKGRYWAHPWPTWSLLLNGRPDGSWPVEDAVPLRGIFFLRQSAFDQLQPVGRTQGTALVMESAIDLIRTITMLSEAGESQEICKDHVAAAKALAAAVPAHLLQVSLQGQFWREIEQVLPDQGMPVPRDIVGDEELSLARPNAGRPSLPDRGEGPGDWGTRALRAGAGKRTESPPEASDGVARTVCLGRAMNPTLAETDILEVEPYGRRRVRMGDVVCFKSPENAETSVRRVVEVRRDGIRTRGDNNRHNDSWLLRIEDIAGRVVVAQQGPRRRSIAGGPRGQATAFALSVVRPLRAFARRMPHRLDDLAVKAGPLGRVLPPHLRPRLLELNGRRWMILKVLIGEREIGRYDCRLKTWRIRRPFRLFVDRRKLPVPPNWCSPSFVRASPLLNPSEVNVIPSAPDMVSASRCRDFESEPSNRSVGAPRSSGACLFVSAAVEEQGIDCHRQQEQEPETHNGGST